MERSLLDIILFNGWTYYEDWANGKKGAICSHPDEPGVFRFYDPLPDINGWWDFHHKPRKEFPIVCVGIAGCWLIRRKAENVHQTYVYYTDVRFRQYKETYREDPQRWDWKENDWKRAFFCDYIIPEETKLNKMSEPLFEYISGNDAKLVHDIMSFYMDYLEKCKEEWMPAPTNIFNYKLNEKAIEDTIRITYNKYNKTGLGEINFTYAIHYFFESINWLSDVKDTRFVSWMKYHKLMTVKASNLKQARKEDERVVSLINDLHSIFQSKHPNKERWIDKNEYYLEGYEHSKINDGNH